MTLGIRGGEALVRRHRQPLTGTASVVLENIEGETDGDTALGDSYCSGSFTTLRYSYPLKLLIPSYASATHCKWMYPVTFGGGLVGGDSVRMDFRVKENCCALLSGQESTKIYHCEDDLQTTQELTCHIEAGALLCVLSDPLVCYQDANFLQTQTIRMSSAGNLVYLDWLIGGRVALDELWQFNSYQNKTDIYIDGQLVYRDNYHLSDNSLVPVSQSMAPFQVIGTMIVLGQKLRSVSEELLQTFGKVKGIESKGDPDLVCSISPLKYNLHGNTVTGVYIRFLATSSGKAYAGVIHSVIAPLLPVLGGNPFKHKY